MPSLFPTRRYSDLTRKAVGGCSERRQSWMVEDSPVHQSSQGTNLAPPQPLGSQLRQAWLRLNTPRWTPILHSDGVRLMFSRRPVMNRTQADVAQLVERNLAKVEVASSSLVVRSEDRKSTRLNSSHSCASRLPSSV